MPVSEKDRIRTAKWHAENAERVREIKRAYKLRNPNRDKEYYEKNREVIRVKQREYCAQNSEAARARKKAWVAANPERAADGFRRYVAAHRVEVNLRNALRRKYHRQATPVWADLDEIRKIYVVARDKNLEVDHVIPLRGKLVCGLHVPENLQLLPRTENRCKNNKFEVE